MPTITIDERFEDVDVVSCAFSTDVERNELRVLVDSADVRIRTNYDFDVSDVSWSTCDIQELVEYHADPQDVLYSLLVEDIKAFLVENGEAVERSLEEQIDEMLTDPNKGVVTLLAIVGDRIDNHLNRQYQRGETKGRNAVILELNQLAEADGADDMNEPTMELASESREYHPRD